MCYEDQGFSTRAEQKDKEKENPFRKEALEPIKEQPSEQRPKPEQERMPANRPLEEVEAD